ncbi:MAG: MATE family efflux transporter [Succinivibrionaceae bacterium]|nr:MATE family efflux transporter [Succinivibrionaceae bacterium]
MGPRRRERRQLARLFVPIFLGQLFETLILAVDTAMAGACGEDDLAGVGLGVAIYMPCFMICLGLASAIQPIIAQLHGGGRGPEIPSRMQLSTLLVIGCSLLLIPAVNAALLLVPFSDGEEAMREVARRFLLGASLGLPAASCYCILRGFCEGQGNPVPTLCFGALTLAANTLLNYALIFGALGLPALGGAGAGLATALALWVGALAFLGYALRARRYQAVRPFTRAYPLRLVEAVDFMRLAVPAALGTFAEASCFFVSTILLTPLGSVMVGAHTVALSVSGLCFLLPLSLSICTTVRVGTAMGSHDFGAALLTLREVAALGVAIYLLPLLVMLTLRDGIIALYGATGEVAEVASTLLLLCCCYMLSDTIQCLGMGALRGFKDTRTISVVTICCFWGVGLPVGHALAYGHLGPGLGAAGYWVGFICGLTIIACCYSLRLAYIFRHRHLPHGMRLSV